MTREQRHSATLWIVVGVLGMLAASRMAWAQTFPSASDATADSAAQVRTIDQHIRRGWEESEISPSAAATEGEYCRRLYLDLLGRIPSIDELDRFLTDRRPRKRSRLVRRLLTDPQYADEYAKHWSTIWSNTLIGRSGGSERNSLINRPGMLAYLQETFRYNKPYDQMVHELVSATGTNRPGSPKFNGAVNFLSGKLADNAAQATAHTSRIFLGLQVQCTQCHNHPFNDWKQSQYWQLNAFFRQATALRRFQPGTRDVGYVELADQDFAGEDSPIEPLEARVYYELRNGTLEAAYPIFVDGTRIETSGFLDDVNRRAELADLIVHSELLPRAIVNRLWAHFLGYGFTKPIDDMGPHNPPVHPELLDYLANELKDHQYDLKQLMSWIVLSRPYSLSSRTTKANFNDDPALGQPPRFSHFYVRQMTAEQLYESLVLASRADKTHASDEAQIQAKNEWLRQFTIAFGTDEGDETTTFDGTISQTLMMFNGDLMRRAVSLKPGSFLNSVVQDPKARYPHYVHQLFKAALARRANRTEIQMAQRLLASHQGDLKAALQDLWWALLNSNEFILNH